jgi:hypothetical protein
LPTPRSAECSAARFSVGLTTSPANSLRRCSAKPAASASALEPGEQRVGQVGLRPVEQHPALGQLEPGRQLATRSGSAANSSAASAHPEPQRRARQPRGLRHHRRCFPFPTAGHRAKASRDDCKRQIAAESGPSERRSPAPDLPRTLSTCQHVNFVSKQASR